MELFITYGYLSIHNGISHGELKLKLVPWGVVAHRGMGAGTTITRLGMRARQIEAHVVAKVFGKKLASDK